VPVTHSTPGDPGLTPGNGIFCAVNRYCLSPEQGALPASETPKRPGDPGDRSGISAAWGQAGRDELCDTRLCGALLRGPPCFSHPGSAPVVGKSDVPKRRYEILLPAEFNDGRLVADACPLCIPDSLSEVSDTFGAFTFRPDVALGSWTAAGMRYDDQLFLLSIDVEGTAEHRAWIGHFKSHLLERFQQLEIYVTSYPIDLH